MLKGGIFSKIFILIIIMPLIVGTLVLVVTIRERTKAIEEALVSENKILAEVAAKNIESGYYASILPLETLKLISESKNTRFLWVAKPNGEIYLADDPQMLGKIIDDPSLGAEKVLVKDSFYPKDGERIKLIVQPIGIREQEKMPWTLFFGVSLEQVAAAQRKVIFTSFGFFAIVIIFTIFISFYLARGIIKPLKRLKDGAEIIGRGDFKHQIQIKTGDEIEELSGAFNEMAESLGESQSALEEEKNKTLAIINNFADGILAFGPADNLFLINPKAENLFRASAQESIGRSLGELAGSPGLKSLSELLLKEKEDGLDRKELPLRDDLFLEISAIPVKMGEEKLGTLVIAHDITREKKVESLKTEFVSIAAHQLRTPLSSIKWALKMFLDGDLGRITKEQKKFVKKTYESNERMIGLINDLLNVTKIEEGRYLYSLAPTQLESVAQFVINSYKEEAAVKKIKLEFKKPANKLPLIAIDVEKMRLAVQNLIDNAVKYTKEGGLVAISLRLADKRIEFSIKDSGVGIPANQQERVFTKFFRAANVVRLETDGSGLGLFIAKNIIEAHGGKIWFESMEGKGATFFFTLPIK